MRHGGISSRRATILFLHGLGDSGHTYDEAFLAPGLDVLGEQVPVPDDPAFVDGFLALSGGAPPGSVAVWTYGTANRLLDAIDEAVRTEGRPTRLGVQEALATNH